MKFIIAIDPGNKTGITYGYSNAKPITELHDFTPKPATKGSKKIPGRKAEEKHIRYGKLFLLIQKIIRQETNPTTEVVVVCEGAAGFTKGKSAVEVSNKYRGVVEAFAAIHNYTYIGIQPNDLQRWATGKGRAEKTEMMKVAFEKYGYKGTDDNEADSVLLWHFGASPFFDRSQLSDYEEVIPLANMELVRPDMLPNPKLGVDIILLSNFLDDLDWHIKHLAELNKDTN